MKIKNKKCIVRHLEIQTDETDEFKTIVKTNNKSVQVKLDFSNVISGEPTPKKQSKSMK